MIELSKKLQSRKETVAVWKNKVNKTAQNVTERNLNNTKSDFLVKSQPQE